MIKTYACGLLETNTYLVWEEASLEGMIIDCGVDPNIILPFALENKINVKYVVLTHGHFDHADYVMEYERIFSDATIICHETEKSVLLDIEANLSFWGKNAKEYRCNYTYVKEGDVLTLGSSGFSSSNSKKREGTCMNFTVLHTPGHTPGGICLYNEQDKIMFTGDTLFKGSYGRTDFKHGSWPDLKKSLIRLLSMDKDIAFYPGHYESSTIEKEHSLYL